jgi:hypothetical protein
MPYFSLTMDGRRLITAVHNAAREVPDADPAGVSPALLARRVHLNRRPDNRVVGLGVGFVLYLVLSLPVFGRTGDTPAS